MHAMSQIVNKMKQNHIAFPNKLNHERQNHVAIPDKLKSIFGT